VNGREGKEGGKIGVWRMVGSAGGPQRSCDSSHNSSKKFHSLTAVTADYFICQFWGNVFKIKDHLANIFMISSTLFMLMNLPNYIIFKRQNRVSSVSILMVMTSSFLQLHRRTSFIEGILPPRSFRHILSRSFSLSPPFRLST
jgi:hypothetical protein